MRTNVKRARAVSQAGMRLNGKVAIVTGAGGGIGGAICRAFSAEGARLVCVEIDRVRAEQVVDDIRGRDGQATAIIADVAREACAIKSVTAAVKHYGRLDVLVSNAVHDLPLAPLTSIRHDDWRRTMAVNLDSAFLMSKHAIPVMASGGGGSIILVASQLARVARPGRPWYCAAKGAMLNLAKAMALDHAAQMIRVNSLSPGPVETARYLKNFPDLKSARRSHHTLMGRLGDVEEIAAGALFLASDESSFMTGADLLIDGGYSVP